MRIFYLILNILAIDGKSQTKIRPYIELYSDKKYSYIIGLTSHKNHFSETLFAKDYPLTLKVNSNYFVNQIYQVETNFLNNNISQITKINNFDEFRIIKNISSVFYKTSNFGIFKYIKYEINNENIYRIKPISITNKLLSSFLKNQNENYQKQLRKWYKEGSYNNDLTFDEINNILGNILIDFRIEKNREFLKKEVTLENFEMMKSTIDKNQKELNFYFSKFVESIVDDDKEKFWNWFNNSLPSIEKIRFKEVKAEEVKEEIEKMELKQKEQWKSLINRKWTTEELWNLRAKNPTEFNKVYNLFSPSIQKQIIEDFKVRTDTINKLKETKVHQPHTVFNNPQEKSKEEKVETRDDEIEK